MALHFIEEVRGRRAKYELLRAQLVTERSSFDSHWRELSEYILPRRSRFFVNDKNQGNKRNQRIIDSTGTFAARTLAAGMMSGISSPSRPWYFLESPDPHDRKIPGVAEWSHEASNLMRNVHLKTNLYRVLPTVYEDMGVFATGLVFMEEDLDKVVRFKSFPIGSYYVGSDSFGVVNVFCRQFQMTVRQIVDTFGRNDGVETEVDWSNISQSVRSLYESGQTEAWFDIIHMVKPNENHDPNKLESRFKKYISVYYEEGVSKGNSQSSAGGLSDDARDKFLRESGYDIFPALCPRWSITGEDVYGTNCPGMMALGDIKQLQQGERRSMQAIDKTVSPPMTAPASMRGAKVSLLPGDITFMEPDQTNQKFEPAYQLRFDNAGLENKQIQVRQRIDKSFLVDIIMMANSLRDRQRTATEMSIKDRERMMVMGPVLESMNEDLFNPIIDGTFYYMQKQGLLPDPPPELEGKELNIKYVSIMANAQKLSGLDNVDRFVLFLGEAAKIDERVLDKVNRDELVDLYGEMTSIPPKVIVEQDLVDQKRQARAEQEQQAMQAETMRQEAAAMKDMSQANTDQEGTALTDMLEGGIPSEGDVAAA